MPKTKVTPRAKHPNVTKQFLDATQIALEMFDDEISSFTDEIKEKAYERYVTLYRDALIPVWNSARFANIDTALKAVTDKKMQQLKTMAEHLKTSPPHPKVMQTTFYRFLPCRDLLPVSLFCIRFPGFLVPRCALLFWGIFVIGLRVETFVRVLRSSELSLNNCK